MLSFPYLQNINIESIEYSAQKFSDKFWLNIKGPVFRLQTAKIEIVAKLISKIEQVHIVISEPFKILFARPKVSEYFSKVVEDAKIQCAFELLEAANSAESSGNKAECKICFVALHRRQLEHAIGNLQLLRYCKFSN